MCVHRLGTTSGPIDASRLGGTASGGVVVGVVALLFGAIFLLRTVYANSADATLVLFIVPIALCAIQFGARGGLAASVVALGLLAGWQAVGHEDLGPVGLATRATAYLLVGGLLGRFIDQRRALEVEMTRHYELSLDLFCTATFDGYLERLNPAWERELGYTEAELFARPFLEFVHPDDRVRTAAETAKLAEEGTDTIGFRNRYRRADGAYRWLEWSARAVPEERRIYATARDVTVQQEAEEAMQTQSARLEGMVEQRTRALQQARIETLRRLAAAAEYRDDDTHEHTERVGRTAALIARQLRLPEETAALLRHAAPLHDIGKVGISDQILLKPGRLTDEEFAIMREHARIGATILAEGNFAVLRMAQEVALTHHERWDGTGYPDRRAGGDIPLTGRIVAVADVFDALTHGRPYKSAWPIEDAVAEIERQAGKHFDPDVVTGFLALHHQSLLEPVEDYDAELPLPPLTTPAESDPLAADARAAAPVA